MRFLVPQSFVERTEKPSLRDRGCTVRQAREVLTETVLEHGRGDTPRFHVRHLGAFGHGISSAWFAIKSLRICRARFITLKTVLKPEIGLQEVVQLAIQVSRVYIRLNETTGSLSQGADTPAIILSCRLLRESCLRIGSRFLPLTLRERSGSLPSVPELGLI